MAHYKKLSITSDISGVRFSCYKLPHNTMTIFRVFRPVTLSAIAPWKIWRFIYASMRLPKLIVWAFRYFIFYCDHTAQQLHRLKHEYWKNLHQSILFLFFIIIHIINPQYVSFFLQILIIPLIYLYLSIDVWIMYNKQCKLWQLSHKSTLIIFNLLIKWVLYANDRQI